MAVERRGVPRYARRRAGDSSVSRRGAARVDGGGRVADIQRSRLLAAAVGAVEEFGYTDATVARITERARVSRRTFYDLFDNREECLVAVLEGAVEQITAEIAGAQLEGLCWRERVRGGLWVILSFFDREPELARVCVVQSQRAAHPVLERRQEILNQLAAIIEEGRKDTVKTNGAVGLTGQGVVGGVLTILYARLLKPEDERLRDLLGELMALLVLPYEGPTVAQGEQSRPVPPPVLILGERESLTATLDSVQPLVATGMRLTHRTACVLQDLAEHPGSSNRQVADRAGINDQGQISKLLARLARFGLVTNHAGEAQARGEPNRWTLTPTGQQVTHTITAHTIPRTTPTNTLTNTHP